MQGQYRAAVAPVVSQNRDNRHVGEPHSRANSPVPARRFRADRTRPGCQSEPSPASEDSPALASPG